jgi:hypothetical protein
VGWLVAGKAGGMKLEIEVSKLPDDTWLVYCKHAGKWNAHVSKEEAMANAAQMKESFGGEIVEKPL